jgi:transcriptional regulator with XRE-family HTH domain
MTLPEVLKEYGITGPADLHKRTGITRQYAYALWSGERRLGANTARQIYERIGIPLEVLLTAEPPSKRPRKQQDHNPTDSKGGS